MYDVFVHCFNITRFYIMLHTENNNKMYFLVDMCVRKFYILTTIEN